MSVVVKILFATEQFEPGRSHAIFRSRLEEYERVRKQLAGRLEELDQRGHRLVIFVGPRAMKELMEQIIEEKALKVYIKDYFGTRAGLQSHGIEPDDVVLLFDRSSEGPNNMSRDRGIPRKILSLW